jgi:hypothetical protein
LPSRNGQDQSQVQLNPIKSLPLHKAGSRCTRCHQCEHIIEARRWEDRVSTCPKEGMLEDVH